MEHNCSLLARATPLDTHNTRAVHRRTVPGAGRRIGSWQLAASAEP